MVITYDIFSIMNLHASSWNRDTASYITSLTILSGNVQRSISTTKDPKATSARLGTIWTATDRLIGVDVVVAWLHHFHLLLALTWDWFMESSTSLYLAWLDFIVLGLLSLYLARPCHWFFLLLAIRHDLMLLTPLLPQEGGREAWHQR